MNINLSKITNNGLSINEFIVLNKEFYQNTEIIEIKDLHIEGLIKYDYENNLDLDLMCKGVFLLSDALTLEPINYPFTLKIEEKIEDIEEEYGNFYEKSKNSLDISEILWENIVLEVPISITNHKSEDLHLKGEGWELVSEKKRKSTQD